MELGRLENINLATDDAIMIDPTNLPDVPMVAPNIKPPENMNGQLIEIPVQENENLTWIEKNKDLLIIGGILLALILLSSLKSKT